MELKTNQCQSDKQVTLCEIDFTWTLENFNTFIKEGKKYVKSQAFFIPNNDKYRWVLKIECNRDGSTNDEILVGLFLNSKDMESIHASYTIKLMNVNQQIISNFPTEKIKMKFFPNKGWYYGHKLYDLLPCIEKNILFVHCYVCWETVIHTARIGPPKSFDLPYRPSLLADDLSKMMNYCEFNDVVVVANDGTEFRASKFMLAARSPVFAEMFMHETKEKLESKVKIEDMGADTIKAMLDFIYANKVDKANCEIEDLLVAADKYDITALKSFCEDELICNISTENAARCLLLADRHGVKKLKSKSLEFIRFHVKDVILTEAMTKLKETRPGLMDDILKILVLDA